MEHLAIERQLQLEDDMRGMGVARYLRKMTASDEAALPPGMAMLRQTVNPLCEHIAAWAKELREGNPRRFGVMLKHIETVGFEAAAYLTMRRAVNALALQVKAAALAIGLGDDIESEIEYAMFKAANPKMFKSIADRVQTSGSEEYRTKVMHLMRRRAGVMDLGWSKEEKLKLGTKLLEMAIESTGLLELSTISEGKNNSVHYILGTQKARDWLAQQHIHCQTLSPLYLPMVCRPTNWTSPTHGGFLTHRLDMVKTPNRAYLEELSNIDMPMVYESVNALQGTRWRINKRIHEVMREVWELGGDRAGLPRKDPKELPNKPLDINENEESLKQWKSVAKHVHTFNNRNMSKVVSVAQKLWVAEKFAEVEAFHYVWTLDWRGRAYPVGTFVHPQSDDSGKSLLEFADGKPLGTDGADWLAVQLANTWGNDKVSYEDRILWAYMNSADILSYARDPLVNKGWMEADAPFGFLAACFEWHGYTVDGPDHVCHLPIQVDGSCNGLQNFSALLLDPIGGKATNLIPSETPQDIYGIVAATALKMMQKDHANGIEEAGVMLGGYGRKWTKRNCMTYAYSVTQFGMKDQLVEELRKAADDGNPVDLKGLGDFKVAGYLAGLNLKAIGKTVVAAKNAMDWLKDVAKIAASDNLPLFWTNPAGMPIQQAYMETTGGRVDVYFGGKRTKFFIRVAGKTLNTRKQAAGIAPNVIHSFDSGHMMRTLVKGTAAGVTDFSFIHDSFGTHACDMTVLSDNLREAFIEQYSDDLLAKFRDEIVEQLTRSGAEELIAKIPELPPRGTLDLNQVRESRYFFA